MIVIGIDPGWANFGWSIVDIENKTIVTGDQPMKGELGHRARTQTEWLSNLPMDIDFIAIEHMYGGLVNLRLRLYAMLAIVSLWCCSNKVPLYSINPGTHYKINTGFNNPETDTLKAFLMDKYKEYNITIGDISSSHQYDALSIVTAILEIKDTWVSKDWKTVDFYDYKK